MLGGLVALCGIVLSLVAVAMRPNLFVQPLSSFRRVQPLPKAKSRMLMIAGALLAIGSVISLVEEQSKSSTPARSATANAHATRGGIAR